MSRRSGVDLRCAPLVLVSTGIHGLAAATLVVSPNLWEAALTSVLANHAALAAASMSPRSALLGTNMTRLPDSFARRKAIALTFDDGPDPRVTPAVLALLDSARQKATFFCVGKRAEAHPEIVAAIRSGGHAVENHTYRHSNTFALQGPGGMRRDIILAQRAIQQSGGGVPTLFRAPAGMMNPWLFPVLVRADLALVSWSRRGFDTISRQGTRVAARLVRSLAPGDILLLHDGSSARDATGRPVVLEALPRVLDAMHRLGVHSEALGPGRNDLAQAGE